MQGLLAELFVAWSIPKQELTLSVRSFLGKIQTGIHKLSVCSVARWRVRLCYARVNHLLLTASDLLWWCCMNAPSSSHAKALFVPPCDSGLL